jgi:hypothetical protein
MPIDPLTIMAAAQGALGIGQMVKGAIQGSKKAPKMEIPQAAQQALQIAKTQAGQTQMPGQSIMEDKLASQAAAATQRLLESSGGGGGALGGIAQINQGLSNQMGGILMNQANYVAGQKQNLQNQLGNMAGWQDRQFQMNEMQPYLQEMDASRRSKDAGMQNLWGAASGFVKGQETKKMWDNYLGSQQKQMDQNAQQFQQQMELWKQGQLPPPIPQTILPETMPMNEQVDIPLFAPQGVKRPLSPWQQQMAAYSQMNPKTGQFYPEP